MRTLIGTALLAVALPALALAEPEPPPAAQVQSEKEGVEEDGYRVSLSMPTEDDRASWLEPGLRVELAIDRGVLSGRTPALRIDETTFHLRTRLRIDPLWSLAATFGYSIVRGDYTGVRWSALVEPIFHPLPSLGLSLGLGYGGLSISQLSVSPVTPGASEEIGSRTLDDSEKISTCSGGAWVSRASIEYLAVVGPLFSTGPYFSAEAQRTACEQGLGRTDRETGMPALGRQWWTHFGGSIGWWFSWR